MTLMQKEIFEQPEALKNCLSYNKETFEKLVADIKKAGITNVVIAARGTSDHAGISVSYTHLDVYKRQALAFIGCPHLTINQLVNWTERIETSLNKNGIKKVCIKTVLCAAPDVIDTFKTMPEYQRLLSTGAKLTYICPLMYMNNPKCKAMPIITCSNKLRTYTVARYGTEDEILSQITKGAN